MQDALTHWILQRATKSPDSRVTGLESNIGQDLAAIVVHMLCILKERWIFFSSKHGLCQRVHKEGIIFVHANMTVVVHQQWSIASP